MSTSEGWLGFGFMHQHGKNEGLGMLWEGDQEKNGKEGLVCYADARQCLHPSLLREGDILKMGISFINVNFPYKRASPVSSVSKNNFYVKEAHCGVAQLVSHTSPMNEPPESRSSSQS